MKYPTKHSAALLIAAAAGAAALMRRYVADGWSRLCSVSHRVLKRRRQSESPSEHRTSNLRRNGDESESPSRRIDEALEATFPASDPPAF